MNPPPFVIDVFLGYWFCSISIVRRPHFTFRRIEDPAIGLVFWR